MSKVCRSCGNETNENAKFCAKCGTPVSVMCRNCGSELRENAKFCGKCGTPVSVMCRNCGSELRENAKFCSKCGTPVSEINAKEKRPVNNRDYELEEYKDSPFNQFGGSLAVFAYIQLFRCCMSVLLSINDISLAFITHTGKILSIISAVMAVIICFFSIKTFRLIQKKSPLFLKNYEIQCISSLITSMLTLTLASTFSLDVIDMVNAIFKIFFVIGTLLLFALYCSKSVRVRVYFGTDIYFRKSLFFKRLKGATQDDIANNRVAQEQKLVEKPIVQPIVQQKDMPKLSIADIEKSKMENVKICNGCGEAVVEKTTFCKVCGTRVETKETD